MGHISDSSLCCCNLNVKDIYFSLNEKKSDKCDIILNHQYEVNGFSNEEKHRILTNICKKPWIENCIFLINQLLHNNYKLSKNFINKTKNIFERILDEFLNKDEKFFYLKDYNSIKKKLDLETINIFIKLFKIIYDRKSQIKIETIIFFIKSIDYSLKDEKILNEKDIDFLISKLKKIYLSEKEFKVEKINNIEYTDIGTFFKEEIRIDTEVDIKSIKSSKNFSLYSKNSQSQIIKMEEEIKDLKSIIENSILKTEKKKYIKVKFLDVNIKEEFPINIFLSYNDKFSSLIEKFYEKYPNFEEKGIKRFLINEKPIKRSELISNIELDDSTKILIEY